MEIPQISGEEAYSYLEPKLQRLPTYGTRDFRQNSLIKDAYAKLGLVENVPRTDWIDYDKPEKRCLICGVVFPRRSTDRHFLNRHRLFRRQISPLLIMSFDERDENMLEIVKGLAQNERIRYFSPDARQKREKQRKHYQRYREKNKT